MRGREIYILKVEAVVVEEPRRAIVEIALLLESNSTLWRGIDNVHRNSNGLRQHLSSKLAAVNQNESGR